LDAETRGFIESLIDNILENEIVKNVKWVQEDVPISSLGEMALGYAIGYLRALAVYTLILRIQPLSGLTKNREERLDHEVWEIIKRRLPEISEKISKELNR